jgi:fructose-1,6-bisphosphatase/inositol monophosphatase family enzyme
MVADGRVDGFNLISISDWDTAAGSLILREAGGECRLQRSVFDGFVELVASNGKIQQEYESLIDDHLR